MSLIGELKRRNVFRAAAAYVAVSWLTVQVVETLFPIFGYGETAVRTIVLVLAIGVVPALIAAWFLELTPEGLRRDREVDHEAPGVRALAKRVDRGIVVVLLLAVSYFAVDKFVLDPARDTAREEAAKAQGRAEALVESYGDNSIVVLPFDNMSADPGQEYFSDGIAEELLNLLSRIPELRVVSRQTSFSLKGQGLDVVDIGERLEVAHVLSGSVRRSGEAIRITAQLVDARSDTQLWSKTYDKPLGEVFAIQDEIAADVAENLQVALTGSLPGIGRSDTRAYDHYLRGRHIWHRRGNVDLQAAIDNFSEAVRIDPTFAKGWAALASAYVTYPSYSSKGHATWPLAEDAAARALELDPELGEPYAILATFAESRLDWSEAQKLYAEAIRRDDLSATASYWYSEFLAKVGKYDESVRYNVAASRLDPTYMVPQMDLAFHAVNFRDFDRAANEFQSLWDKGFRSPECWMGNFVSRLLIGDVDAAEAWVDIAQMPDNQKALFRRFIAVESGESTNAQAIVDEILNSPDLRLPHQMVILLLSRLEAYDELYRVLDYRLDRGWAIDSRVLWGPVRSLRERQEFADVVRRLGLVAYWEEHGWGNVCVNDGGRIDCEGRSLTPERFDELTRGDRRAVGGDSRLSDQN